MNKTDTRVEAMLHLPTAAFLTEEQRQTILAKLAKRISKEGYVSVTCQRTRSQLTNKDTAIANLQALLNKALEVEKPRKPPLIPRIVKEKRIQSKKVNSLKKQSRTNWKKLL